MTAGRAHAGGEPAFVGRDALLDAALGLAESRPGLLVVTGATWVGTTRFTTELARKLEATGLVVARPRGGGVLADRLAAGLSAAELRSDPVTAAKLTPYVALLGDLDGALEDARQIGRALAGTAGLLVGCARSAPAGLTSVQLPPLEDPAARSIVADAAPDADPDLVALVVAVGAGRPGALVPMARANPIAPVEGHALRVPSPLARRLDPVLASLSPAAVDLARWSAVLGGLPVSDLAHIAGRSEDGVAGLVDELARAGVMELWTGAAEPIRFADPLMPLAIVQSTPPTELRRRHAAALGLRRLRGAAAFELVADAVATADGDEVVALSLRAAEASRTRGAGEDALRHAERALTWSARGRPESERLDAQLQRGLALGSVGRWDEAARVLEETIRRLRTAGRERAAYRALGEWARVRWYAGYHAEALAILEDNIPEGDEPLAERAQTLHQAAMLAAHCGRHADAYRWASRSFREAEAVGEPLIAVKATNALALAQVFSSASPDGLAHFRHGIEDATAAGLWREVAVTINNESVSLLMLGMVRQAADRAQAGLDFAASHQIGEVDAPLLNNLAEALAAMGRFPEARRAAAASRASYEAMGSRHLEPLEVLLAWIDFSEGDVRPALDALRRLAEDSDPSSPLESLGPLLGIYAHAAHAAGELDEAQAAAASGLERLGDSDDRLDTMMLVAAGAILLPAARAKPYLDELGDSARAGSPLAVALVPYVHGWTSRSAAGSARAFRQAADAFAEADWRWWSARSLMLAALGGGGGQTAIDELLEARRRFREVDAPGWRARCEAELRARGHRFVMASRHPDQGGLSARELEVLGQLAQGLKNREIAERLHIAEKTVTRHLENIYSKLGVSTRTAAVSAAVERGLVQEPAAAGLGGGQ